MTPTSCPRIELEMGDSSLQPCQTPVVPSPPPPQVPQGWRDAEDTPTPLYCRIEQIKVDKQHGALPSRRYQQGQPGHRPGTHLLYVCASTATTN
jgi:hypothetical protein